jgi:formate dehydrogenase major subunit
MLLLEVVTTQVTRSVRMKKVRLGLAGRVAGFVKDWSLPRQIAGQNVMAEAAQSTASKTLRPRLEQADTVGTSICPFCAVGCGQLVYAKNGKPLHIEGDPRSPINQGTLCPKGASTLGVLLSPKRINVVLYRAPYGTAWEERPLDWAMERIARLTKQTRDDSFVEKFPDGRVVNHSLGIGSLGGATLDNEENYLIKKLFGGGLGLVNIENQARI